MFAGHAGIGILLHDGRQLGAAHFQAHQVVGKGQHLCDIQSRDRALAHPLEAAAGISQRHVGFGFSA